MDDKELLDRIENIEVGLLMLISLLIDPAKLTKEQMTQMTPVARLGEDIFNAVVSYRDGTTPPTSFTRKRTSENTH